MKTLYVEDRNKWRAWLEANSQRATEIWLVYYKKATGRPRVDYGEAVEEAICFGWIDSKIKKLDEVRFAQLFTPRKPKSKWSPSNITRARRMIQAGKMTTAGLKVYDPRNQVPAMPTQVPRPLEEQFMSERKAWENFQRFPPSYQRMTIGWVASAKKEETQISRLRQLIAESAANKRIKFM
ncbi:MAG: YdeI/OmpD-associated family protein [Terriglobia bacterium]